ncbi:TniQ family protein [Methylocystis parvus]|uniref:TniQ family protein n=1 Tax=Methylocystis parvus TaxID=134 RepID=UPI0018A6C834|nr:TniQ family protein [Methylocystis parvus]WBK02386.1 TniQ family protein [Methylocystis parvus OBBP]
MTPKLPHCDQLPVVLPPLTDELLSSWIHRHATFYDVPPLAMLRHCLDAISSLRAVDLVLTDEQASRVASMFRTDAANVRRMSLSNILPKSCRLIAAKPMQFCAACARQANSSGPEPVRRSQLLGWRLTCPQCCSQLIDGDKRSNPSPFADYWTDALDGQRLIDDEAERGVRAWASPTELARLLLMRRDPRTAHLKRSGSFRLLGVVVPEADAIVVENQISLPSAANPILPLWLRPALLAGVSIVEREGPAMLTWLQSKIIGQNRTRFSELVSTMLSTHPGPEPLSLLQHN